MGSIPLDRRFQGGVVENVGTLVESERVGGVREGMSSSRSVVMITGGFDMVAIP